MSRKASELDQKAPQSHNVEQPMAPHAPIQRGGTGGPYPPPPWKNTKILGFLAITVPDHLENRNATKPAFNVGPTSFRQRNAI